MPSSKAASSVATCIQASRIPTRTSTWVVVLPRAITAPWQPVHAHHPSVPCLDYQHKAVYAIVSTVVHKFAHQVAQETSCPRQVRITKATQTRSTVDVAQPKGISANDKFRTFRQ